MKTVHLTDRHMKGAKGKQIHKSFIGCGRCKQNMYWNIWFDCFTIETWAKRNCYLRSHLFRHVRETILPNGKRHNTDTFYMWSNEITTNVSRYSSNIPLLPQKFRLKRLIGIPNSFLSSEIAVFLLLFYVPPSVSDNRKKWKKMEKMDYHTLFFFVIWIETYEIGIRWSAAINDIQMFVEGVETEVGIGRWASAPVYHNRLYLLTNRITLNWWCGPNTAPGLIVSRWGHWI